MIDTRNPVHQELVRKFTIAKEHSKASAGTGVPIIVYEQHIDYVLQALQGGCPHGPSH